MYGPGHLSFERTYEISFSAFREKQPIRRILSRLPDDSGPISKYTNTGLTPV